MFSIYTTILLASNCLITNHVLGQPPKLNLDIDLSLQLGPPSSLAPVPPTQGNEDGPSNTIPVFTGDWLKRSFFDARRHVKRVRHLPKMNPGISFEDLKMYFGNYAAVVKSIIKSLDAKGVAAHERDHINIDLELFSEIVREYCNVTFPIHKFVSWRYVGANPKRDPEIYGDSDSFEDSETEYC
ncbi:uncharacterized protein LOC126846854 isoform X2 [Adelges cooleyi]|uniref:uncharacterized protein LOC126846854 isoform X2 n=1 Tax=Adelges cooleyi TaxID=133065 RepID=UPI00217F995F|nr:uncharacterized protein LOC126846854 isoform X2 [Adelges cooleyi]